MNTTIDSLIEGHFESKLNDKEFDQLENWVCSSEENMEYFLKATKKYYPEKEFPIQNGNLNMTEFRKYVGDTIAIQAPIRRKAAVKKLHQDIVTLKQSAGGKLQVVAILQPSAKKKKGFFASIFKWISKKWSK